MTVDTGSHGEAILEQALRLPLKAASLQVLCSAMEACELDPVLLVEEAQARRKPNAAAMLAIAAGLAGRTLTTTQVGRVLSRVQDYRLFLALAMTGVGDRVSMLLDLVESELVSDEKTSAALFAAARLCQDQPCPDRLKGLLRIHARRPLGPEAGCALGGAVLLVDDAAVHQVAQHWIAEARRPHVRHLGVQMARWMEMDPRTFLQEHERVEGALSPTVTVKRTTPRVGRNEPCPCGSGKKYKKCCAEGDRERAFQASPEVQSPADRSRVASEDQLTADDLWDLSWQEIATLDLARLSQECLIHALHRYYEYRLWEEAEGVLEEMSRRGDPRWDIDELRAELIDRALRARAPDLAKRHVALLKDRSRLGAYYRVSMALLEPGPESLAVLEQEAREGLGSALDDNTLIDMAYALLEQAPALGILVTRGIVTPKREFDSLTLLEQVEEARDRLALPMGDAAADIYDHLLARDVDRQVEDASSAPPAVACDSHLDELEVLRDRLKTAASTMDGMRRKLEEQQRGLEMAAREAAGRATRGEATTDHSDAERMERLRARVAELKGLIKEGQAERSLLRRELQNLRRGERSPSPPPRPVAQMDHDRADELEEALPGEVTSRMPVLVPEFSRQSQKQLEEAQPRIAREALRLVADLAAGDAAAWGNAGRLRSASGLWSARVGLRHRLLFRWDAERRRLHLEALIPRRELEETLKQWT